MNRLRKICVFFLILVVTFPGETASAFTFVPKFIKHYQHHNDAHHEINLIGFVIEHLSDKQHHDSNQDHHDDCPLTHKHTIVQFIYILKKAPLVISLNDFVPELEEKSQLPGYNFTFSEYFGSIWQPPKIA